MREKKRGKKINITRAQLPAQRSNKNEIHERESASGEKVIRSESIMGEREALGIVVFYAIREVNYVFVPAVGQNKLSVAQLSHDRHVLAHKGQSGVLIDLTVRSYLIFSIHHILQRLWSRNNRMTR